MVSVPSRPQCVRWVAPMRASAQAPRVDLEVLRQAVSISAILAAHGAELPRRGSRIPCPLCNSRNPSAFSFSDEKGLWQCFVCRAGGDALALARALGGGTFLEAVTAVARIAGIDPGGLPVLSSIDVARRAKIARRRRALRRWRDRRRLELAGDLCELDRDAELLSRLLIRFRAEGDASSCERLWDLFEATCTQRDEAEWIACRLDDDDESEWARLWLSERGPTQAVK